MGFSVFCRGQLTIAIPLLPKQEPACYLCVYLSLCWHRLTCSLANLKVENVSVTLTVANQTVGIPVTAGLRIECSADYYGQYGKRTQTTGG